MSEKLILRLRQSSNPRIKRCRVRMCSCSVRVQGNWEVIEVPWKHVAIIVDFLWNFKIITLLVATVLIIYRYWALQEREIMRDIHLHGPVQGKKVYTVSLEYCVICQRWIKCT